MHWQSRYVEKQLPPSNTHLAFLEISGVTQFSVPHTLYMQWFADLLVTGGGLLAGLSSPMLSSWTTSFFSAERVKYSDFRGEGVRKQRMKLKHKSTHLPYFCELQPEHTFLLDYYVSFKFFLS